MSVCLIQDIPMDYKIIDNFLDKKDFNVLQELMMSNKFAWYFQPSITYFKDDLRTNQNSKYKGYFCHVMYDSNEVFTTQEGWKTLQPLLNKLNIKALIRIKVNLFNRTPKIIKHELHTDYEYKQKGCVFHINTNDGATILEDGTKIESVANRAVILDTTKPHASTTTSNQDRRININLNYF